MRFLSTFKVPDVAVSVIDRIVSADDIGFVEALATEVFTVEDARTALVESTGEPWSEARVAEFLDGAYRRGVIRLLDESFTRFAMGSFYDRLEVFVVTEPETYHALSRETQVALDGWYLEAYMDSLGDEQRPTSDRVVSRDEAITYVDTIERPIWLNRCDCRTLAGRCDKPVDTCISFRSGINTMSHRGWSKAITKAEAQAVIRSANAAGLMQTVNDNGICNCCSDCCYLFRAQKARGSEAAWPVSENVARVDSSLCIACGLCVDRCPFGALELVGDEIVRDAELCRGCGLCAETCPTSAIALVPRNSTEREAQ